MTESEVNGAIHAAARIYHGTRVIRAMNAVQSPIHPGSVLDKALNFACRKTGVLRQGRCHAIFLKIVCTFFKKIVLVKPYGKTL